jgi:hypothetical protein
MGVQTIITTSAITTPSVAESSEMPLMSASEAGTQPKESCNPVTHFAPQPKTNSQAPSFPSAVTVSSAHRLLSGP